MIQRFAATSVFTLIVGAVSWMAAPSAFGDIGGGSWRMTGSLLQAHYDEKVVPLANGRVLVVHAEDEEVTPTHPRFTESLATELYDPGTGSWALGPKPPGRNATTIIALADGGALLLGETACGESPIRCPTNETYRLNSSDSAWTQSAPMREARVRPTMVRLADGDVLVAGGFGRPCTPMVASGYSCAPLSSVEIFDPATGAWAPAAPMPTPHGGSSATLLSDGTVLLVGGSQTEHVLRYDPVSDRWTTLGAPPSPLTGTDLLSLPGDRAIALGFDSEAGFFGSYGGAGKRVLPLCDSIPEIYSATHNTWTVAPPLPGEPISCSANAALLTDGQILYANEVRYRGEAHYDARYVLDPHQQCWTMTGSPLAPHEGILAALMGDRALDVGGITGSEASFAGVEIYSPSPQTCSVSQRIQTSIFRRLAPQGNTATVTGMLARGYRFSLPAIRSGRLRVEWYFMRKESEGRPGPVLVGAGRASSTRTGLIKLTLRLTAAGRKLLKRSSSSIPLTADGKFTTKRGKIVTATRPFTLSR